MTDTLWIDIIYWSLNSIWLNWHLCSCSLQIRKHLIRNFWQKAFRSRSKSILQEILIQRALSSWSSQKELLPFRKKMYSFIMFPYSFLVFCVSSRYMIYFSSSIGFVWLIDSIKTFDRVYWINSIGICSLFTKLPANRRHRMNNTWFSICVFIIPSQWLLLVCLCRNLIFCCATIAIGAIVRQRHIF